MTVHEIVLKTIGKIELFFFIYKFEKCRFYGDTQRLTE